MLVRQLEDELRHQKTRGLSVEVQSQLENLSTENDHLTREVAILRETIKVSTAPPPHPCIDLAVDDGPRHPVPPTPSLPPLRPMFVAVPPDLFWFPHSAPPHTQECPSIPWLMWVKAPVTCSRVRRGCLRVDTYLLPQVLWLKSCVPLVESLKECRVDIHSLTVIILLCVFFSVHDLTVNI